MVDERSKLSQITGVEFRVGQFQILGDLFRHAAKFVLADHLHRALAPLVIQEKS